MRCCSNCAYIKDLLTNYPTSIIFGTSGIRNAQRFYCDYNVWTYHIYFTGSLFWDENDNQINIAGLQWWSPAQPEITLEKAADGGINSSLEWTNGLLWENNLSGFFWKDFDILDTWESRGRISVYTDYENSSGQGTQTINQLWDNPHMYTIWIGGEENWYHHNAYISTPTSWSYITFAHMWPNSGVKEWKLSHKVGFFDNWRAQGVSIREVKERLILWVPVSSTGLRPVPGTKSS